MSNLQDDKLNGKEYPMTSIEVLNRNKVMSGSSDHKLSGNLHPMTSIEVLNKN